MIRLRLAELGRRRAFVSVGAIAVGVAIVLAVAVVRSDGADALSRSLEAEFSGAYPAEPVGGGEIVEIDLVAGLSTARLVDGQSAEVWACNQTVPAACHQAWRRWPVRAIRLSFSGDELLGTFPDIVRYPNEWLE